ncbi:EamA family transporter [Mesorhizobium sp. LHD-90]|uniref:EamA family transporter n=1 Tax=Mesorhizobium sp. LHD-90 TaxID=3071414 RepID=UPI0027E19EEE|nr:EamA family transporter [Mesorhizobium sp. LHD-90]MDQ6437759.1 EamA family transporter [Mesorhizobium sp. LHD-90]
MSALDRAAEKIPPQAWFGVSAVFHYLGPSFAVLLFPAVGVYGVAWMRIASAALIFAPFTRPLRTIRLADRRTRWLLIALGLTLAAMNFSFYLALERLPMSLVAAMEFVSTILIAFYGLRTRRNLVALSLTAAGVAVLIDIKWSSDFLGLGFSALNAALFGLYIVLGHRIAERGAGQGVETLGAAMAVALVVAFPFGFMQALKAFSAPQLILAGVGVGLCSSVIPYISDQLAMSRLPRATFALMLALLPATATAIAAIVLAQIPSARDLAGIALVMVGVALHRQVRPDDESGKA